MHLAGTIRLDVWPMREKRFWGCGYDQIEIVLARVIATIEGGAPPRSAVGRVPSGGIQPFHCVGTKRTSICPWPNESVESDR